MLKYNQSPVCELDQAHPTIASFVSPDATNIDWKTVESFGEEWTKFASFSEEDLERIGDDYFDIVTDEMLNSGSLAMDVGCGTGRWTKYIARRCKFVEAIDPSKAVFPAAALLQGLENVRVTHADVANIPFADDSFDFVFSLGVLHHIPDTALAMQRCVDKLKPGGHFLVYLYYSLDNKGLANKFLFHSMNSVRRVVCKFPPVAKRMACDALAVGIYLPNALATHALKAVVPGETYKRVPLAYYHDKSFNVMRNDALDRFGTPLEQRFSRQEIVAMMEACGLEAIRVSDQRPYWHAIGRKK